jgi:hypothetical protein
MIDFGRVASHAYANAGSSDRRILGRRGEAVACALRGIAPCERDLFPPDVLRGASPEWLFRRWIDATVKPRLREAGDEGRLWWRTITKIDLSREPELLVQALAVLNAWFLPGYEKYADTLALLLIIRRLASHEDLDH